MNREVKEGEIKGKRGKERVNKMWDRMRKK